MNKTLLFLFSCLGAFALTAPAAMAAPAAMEADDQCGGGGGPPPPPPGPPGPSYPVPGAGRATTPSTPSAPSAPSRPSTPSSPGSPGKPNTPTTPATPGSPAAPAGPGTLGAAPTAGAAPLPTGHGRTARTFLKMKWDYPVQNFFTPARHEAFTVAKAFPKALPRMEAFREVSLEDRRPLLVLRECHYCNGTDDALLSSTSGNERTLIMTRWFHCVKLPLNVLHEEHIFRNLFPEEHPPHVFLASWDGSNVIPFEGDANQTDLWEGMYTMLASEYRKDAHKAVREIELLVAQYDMLDEKITRLEYDYEHEVEESGEDSRKAKKLKKKLDGLNKDLAKLQETERKVSDLKLKPSRKAAAQPVEASSAVAR